MNQRFCSWQDRSRKIQRAISFVVAFTFWLIPAGVHAQDTAALKFRESFAYAPYMYRNTNANGAAASVPQGYIPTLLKYLSDDHGIKIDYVEVPRNRLESAFQLRKLDGAILSERWVTDPGKFVFTQPLGLYRTVIYTSDMPSTDLVPLASLKSQYVCARRGYRYPNLDLLWEANNLIRVDFTEEKLQLEGLISERCQYAVMDEAIGRWYARRHFPGHTLTIVSEESRVPLTLGFHREKSHYAELFDSTIRRLRANGELAILQRVFGVIPYSENQNQTQ
ncbi:MAG: transporter substrate-binding domain-containing protein [Ketobacteraceae bacterium]|nr:transporter substrate-binding domain-containing protein [Ketobacteraceae bacterium]